MLTIQRTRLGFGLQPRTWAIGIGLDFDPDEEDEQPIDWYFWIGFGPFILDLTRFTQSVIES